MRIGPAPLIPAFPIRPDRQEVYPRALGPVFVGNPFLDLPEGKPKLPEAQAPRRALEPRPEPAFVTQAEPRFQPLESLGAPKQGPGNSRPPVGSLLDLDA